MQKFVYNYCMNNRLEAIRQTIDKILRGMTDAEQSRAGFIHLYGVSALAVLLATRRKVDPELAAVAGMLHDIWSYSMNNPSDHARLGSKMAADLLTRQGDFTPAEIGQISAAIAAHSSKQRVEADPLAEVLKDADVLHHHLYNPAFPAFSHEAQRLQRVLAELGV